VNSLSLHDNAIRELEYRYRKKGYRTIINAADRARIPDLLLQAPNGELVWVEVESTKTRKAYQRFKNLREELKLNGVKLVVRYLRTKRGWTKLARDVKPSEFYLKEEKA